MSQGMVCLQSERCEVARGQGTQGQRQQQKEQWSMLGTQGALAQRKGPATLVPVVGEPSWAT